MRCVEAPQRYERLPGDGPSIFLAGGITGCPDWQSEALTRLAGTPLVLFNPRRAAFDVGRGDNAVQQIAWEYEHLTAADVTLFWFPRCDPRETVQPIALYELGMAVAAARAGTRRFAVGTDPDYPRRLDVEEQLRHALPGWPVHHTLHATVDAAASLAG
ncbi:nucleoside 2-deoxyribosyltransferase domain-containing protein [Pseudonocardia sp. GCM10023141]|uniref:nucleoside 2-deoxyribosyltransferase domain-containing protein n=1 Tax=Pseudonocardia sp. GCM10023141 TaxID=3252653 RepID=UPI00361AD366